MIKVSDYIANFLAENNNVAKDIFLVAGGGSMHLIDSLSKHPGLNYICNHHEQACTFAAEGYARVTNKIGVACVTTGPGGTNAITGVYSAWVDSISTLTISGQVRLDTTIDSQPDIKLRQLGDQEVNIVDLVRPITKYAVMIKDENKINYHMQKAIFLAKSSRPGPVWLDIPLDIQGALIDENMLEEFCRPNEKEYNNKIETVLELLRSSKRPVIIAGNGITLADANDEFLRLVSKLKIPVVGTFARYDILKEDNPYFFGRYGTVGHRSANFIVQNSDLILALGARMNIRAISYNWEYFGREAKKIVVDIDEAELNKHTLNIDVKINSDVKGFIKELSNAWIKTDYEEWITKCKSYRSNYPTINETKRDVSKYVNSYIFFDIMSKVSPSDAVFVLGNGTACVSAYQRLKLTGKQKVVVNSGCASMGYDLPAAIGACYGNCRKDIICVTGDGSFQMNLQELQTIVHYKLPIKLFILNNNGYASIRNTQNNFFKGHKVGSDPESGLTFPDTIKIAHVYKFKTYKIENHENLAAILSEVLSIDGSVVCEVMLDPFEKVEPKLSSTLKSNGEIVSKPLEDMFPFLDREEFRRNMIVKVLDE